MKMKITSFFLIGIIIFALGGCANTRTAVHQSWTEQPSHRIAVLPFIGEDPFGEELSDALVTELVNSGFPVMERSRLMHVMKEQSLEYSGAMDSLTLSQTGRLAGVDFIVLGSVSTRSVVPAIEWLLGDGQSQTQVDRVHMRWVNVQNGQVVASMSFRNSRGGSLESIARKMTKALDKRIETMARMPTATFEGTRKVVKGNGLVYAYKQK